MKQARQRVVAGSTHNPITFSPPNAKGSMSSLSQKTSKKHESIGGKLSRSMGRHGLASSHCTLTDGEVLFCSVLVHIFTGHCCAGTGLCISAAILSILVQLCKKLCYENVLSKKLIPKNASANKSSLNFIVPLLGYKDLFVRYNEFRGSIRHAGTSFMTHRRWQIGAMATAGSD